MSSSAAAGGALGGPFRNWPGGWGIEPAKGREEARALGTVGHGIGRSRSQCGIGARPRAKDGVRDQGPDDVARQTLFQEWLEGAQPMELYGYVAGVTFRVPLPERLTVDQAIAFATDAQKKLRVRMCLILDRKRSFWISSDGTTYLTQARAGQPNCPYSTVG